jgi:hypothetical protein
MSSPRLFFCWPTLNEFPRLKLAHVDLFCHFVRVTLSTHHFSVSLTHTHTLSLSRSVFLSCWTCRTHVQNIDSRQEITKQTHVTPSNGTTMKQKSTHVHIKCFALTHGCLQTAGGWPQRQSWEDPCWLRCTNRPGAPTSSQSTPPKSQLRTMHSCAQSPTSRNNRWLFSFCVVVFAHMTI